MLRRRRSIGCSRTEFPTADCATGCIVRMSLRTPMHLMMRCPRTLNPRFSSQFHMSRLRGRASEVSNDAGTAQYCIVGLRVVTWVWALQCSAGIRFCGKHVLDFLLNALDFASRRCRLRSQQRPTGISARIARVLKSHAVDEMHMLLCISLTMELPLVLSPDPVCLLS